MNLLPEEIEWKYDVSHNFEQLLSEYMNTPELRAKFKDSVAGKRSRDDFLYRIRGINAAGETHKPTYRNFQEWVATQKQHATRAPWEARNQYLEQRNQKLMHQIEELKKETKMLTALLNDSDDEIG